MKNQISQEPRGIESDSTDYHSTDIHFYQMTWNLKIWKDKDLSRLLGNLYGEGKFELSIWRTISRKVLMRQLCKLHHLSHYIPLLNMNIQFWKTKIQKFFRFYFWARIEKKIQTRRKNKKIIFSRIQWDFVIYHLRLLYWAPSLTDKR